MPHNENQINISWIVNCNLWDKCKNHAKNIVTEQLVNILNK